MDTVPVPTFTITDRPVFFYSWGQNSQFHFDVYPDDKPLGQDIREWRIRQNFLSSRPHVDCKHALLLEHLRDPIACNQAQLEEKALPVSRWAAEVLEEEVGCTVEPLVYPHIGSHGRARILKVGSPGSALHVSKIRSMMCKCSKPLGIGLLCCSN